jgi:aspartate beta-hydroxylase/beta-hydroxylase
MFPIVLITIPSAYFSLITRTPEFLDRKEIFPAHLKFEQPDTFLAIKKEVDGILEKTDNGLTLFAESYNKQGGNAATDIKTIDGKTRGWRTLQIKSGDTKSPYSHHFPTVMKILEHHPEILSCFVSIVEPGITIPIHTGYYKGLIRYMLPTHIPKDRDNVFLCVNSKKYHWTEGEGVLWDDNYPNKVYNKTKEIRVLLFMDVERPYTGLNKHINRYFINKAQNSKIVKDEVLRTEKQVKL